MQTSQKTDMGDILSQEIRASEQGSARAFDGTIIVSIGDIDSSDPVSVTVGSVGYTNKKSSLNVGDFMLFERNCDEIYEVRLLAKSFIDDFAGFLVSLMHPSHIVGNMSRLNERILWASTKEHPERFTETEATFIKTKLPLLKRK